MDRHNLWIYSDNLKRHKFLKYDFQKKLLKSIKLNKNASYSQRYYAYYLLVSKPKLSSINKLSNRCVSSGRVWSVNRKTNYNRFVFRDETYKSNIPGCRRASW